MSDFESAGSTETPIPGLGLTVEDLEHRIAQDRMLLESGLELVDTFAKAAESQEAARDAVEQAALARGEEIKYVPTDEERTWEEHNNRALTGIAQQKQAVLEVFGLDPRKSALFGDFPKLLARACDPQSPVLYDPSAREFSLMETWGPAVIVISHCPWTGKALPGSLDDLWYELVSSELDTEDWTYEDVRARLPEFVAEDWWISRGL